MTMTSEIFPELKQESGTAVADETTNLPWHAKLSNPVMTLGQQLTQQAQHTTALHLPKLPWLQRLQPVLARVTAMPVSQARYQRRAPSRQPLPTRATREQGTEDSVDSWGSPLPVAVQQRLQRVVGPGVAAVRVHVDDHADAVAHSQAADAVTIGEHIFFRDGQFRPQQDAGLALLAHETTHVLQALQPNADWRRATQAGQQDEEAQALRTEQHSLQQLREPSRGQRFAMQSAPVREPTEALWINNLIATPSPVGYNTRLGPERVGAVVNPAITSVATSATTQPMAAAANRALEQPSPTVTPTPDLEELRRTLYRDLMGQIRAEFERGA